MGNRRMGRKRMFALNKRGQTSTNTAGAAFENAVVSTTVTRQGHEIVTEFAIDLEGTNAEVTGTHMAIDGHLYEGAQQGAHIGQPGLTGSYMGQLTVAQNGYIVGADMVCVETPQGSNNIISLFTTTNATGSIAQTINMATAGQLIYSSGSWAAGDFKSFSALQEDNAGGGEHILPVSGNVAVEDQYLYLIDTSEAAGESNQAVPAAYTAGKYVIRVYGIAEVADKKVDQPKF